MSSQHMTRMTRATFHSRCSGKSNCSMFASNDVFSDVCLHVPKFLVVDYICLKVDHTVVDGSAEKTTTPKFQSSSQTTTSSGLFDSFLPLIYIYIYIYNLPNLYFIIMIFIKSFHKCIFYHHQR